MALILSTLASPGEAGWNEFEDNVTVSALPTAAGLDRMPPGFYACDFNGGGATFTGPANSCYLDSASNYWFKANGWALGGVATKTILGDLTP